MSFWPPAAVLWDMDGTLVDTEPDWIATERALVTSHGGTWTDEDSTRLVGSALIEAGEYIRIRGGLPMTAEQVVETMVERMIERLKESVTWRPGTRSAWPPLLRSSPAEISTSVECRARHSVHMLSDAVSRAFLG